MVFFAFRVITSSSSTIAFLRYLAKATVVACGVSFVKSIIDAVHRPELQEEKMNDVRAPPCPALPPLALPGPPLPSVGVTITLQPLTLPSPSIVDTPPRKTDRGDLRQAGAAEPVCAVDGPAPRGAAGGRRHLGHLHRHLQPHPRHRQGTSGSGWTGGWVGGRPGLLRRGEVGPYASALFTMAHWANILVVLLCFSPWITPTNNDNRS